MRAVFFGLWTAVGVEVPGDCGTFTRAKQSALLFERVLLEGGSLLLRLDGDRVAERWLRPLAPGSGMERAHERLGLEESASGPVVSFDALLDSLRVMDVDWAGVVIPPAEDPTRTLVAAGTEGAARTPSARWLGCALQRDLGVARRLDAALSPTRVFAPLIFPEAQTAAVTRPLSLPIPPGSPGRTSSVSANTGRSARLDG